MKVNEISGAINDDKLALWGNKEYIVMGYKLEKHKGKKHYSVGLKELTRPTVYWVGIDKVELKEDQ